MARNTEHDNLAARPWVINGRTGRTVTYADLHERPNQLPATIRPLCQPAATVDAFMEITATVAFGAQLTLFDSDFGELELTALDYGTVGLNV
jgi:hypothetical protein